MDLLMNAFCIPFQTQYGTVTIVRVFYDIVCISCNESC